MYFSGQGKVYAADRDSSGNPGAFRYLGNVPELKIGLSVDFMEHKESISGSRIMDQRTQKQMKGTVSVTLEELTSANLALALYGQTPRDLSVASQAVTGPGGSGTAWSAIAIALGAIVTSAGNRYQCVLAGTATVGNAPTGTAAYLVTADGVGWMYLGPAAAELLPSGLMSGDYVKTRFPNILTGAGLVVKDSVPGTRVVGTDYQVINAKTGLIQMLSAGLTPAVPVALTNQTTPWTLNYGYNASNHVEFLTSAPKERWLRFEGLNTADPAAAQVTVDLYRVQLDPLKDFGLLQDDFAKFQMDGSLLYDTQGSPGRNVDGLLGGFGKITHSL